MAYEGEAFEGGVVCVGGSDFCLFHGHAVGVLAAEAGARVGRGRAEHGVADTGMDAIGTDEEVGLGGGVVFEVQHDGFVL